MMAPLHSAARRAVEYFDDDPAMMEPNGDDLGVMRERPSLLAYRPTLALRSASSVFSKAAPHAPHVPHQQQPRASLYQSQPHAYAYATRASMDMRASWTSNEHSIDGTDLDFDDWEAEEEETKQEERDEDDDACWLLPMPFSAAEGTVPLLELGDDDGGEQEADVIICDPSRLPRTTIIDEDGFTVDHAALLGSGGGGVGMGHDSVLTRPGAVIKAGLLFKQGFSFMNGGWKVRYVVLTSSKLTFFKEERGGKRGEINLKACSTKSIEIMPRDSVFDGAQATMWRFAIKAKGRRVLLSAYTEAEMKEWLRCIHVALAVQSSGVGRFTDLVVPNGTLLAGKGDGLMRSSGSRLLR